MKINEINIPTEVSSDYSLKEIHMKKLGDIVIIAGKNGSGKTRLLNLIKRTVQTIPTLTEAETIKENLDGEIMVKASYEEQIEQLKQSLESVENFNRIKITADIESNRNHIDTYTKSIDKKERQLKHISYISFSPFKSHQKILEFVPKSLTLSDSYKMTKEEIAKNAEGISTPGMTTMERSVFPAIQLIQDRKINAGSSMVKHTTSEAELKQIGKKYDRLCDYIKLFLNTNLERDIDGNATLYGRRLAEAKLSDGQKVLLQFCLAIYGQEADLNEVILMLDEPENHLHPEALLEVLDKIKNCIPNGQLWIATHSVNILAHFDPSDIWYMENGQLSYAGNVPEKVLHGLLGNENEREKLSSFLSLPAKMASDKFAFECLFNPQVLMTKNDDPQTLQIYKIIAEHYTTEKKALKVLDFGMGKGRLISSIHENGRMSGMDVPLFLDYYGYDPFSDHKDSCELLLSSIYDNERKRYFSTNKDALTHLDEGTFDFIIMCNVLHEIDPSEWLDLFTSPTSLMKLLKPDGHLLIVEDQFLAIGEKAHTRGFLVLDELEFKRLFNIPASSFKSIDYRKDGRLKAHFIPTQFISNISQDTRRTTLETLANNAKIEIKKLRSAPANFKNGRLHSFWAQQLANAQLALETL